MCSTGTTGDSDYSGGAIDRMINVKLIEFLLDVSSKKQKPSHLGLEESLSG